MSEANQLAALRTETNTQMAVYSQKCSMVLANEEEPIQMFYRSEEAPAKDRDRMMDIVARHVDSKRAAAHAQEMNQELSAQGNADMRALPDDMTMVAHE